MLCWPWWIWRSNSPSAGCGILAPESYLSSSTRSDNLCFLQRGHVVLRNPRAHVEQVPQLRDSGSITAQEIIRAVHPALFFNFRCRSYHQYNALLGLTRGPLRVDIGVPV